MIAKFQKLIFVVMGVPDFRDECVENRVKTGEMPYFSGLEG